MVVPPNLHPKMIIFSRKTHGCWGKPPNSYCLGFPWVPWCSMKISYDFLKAFPDMQLAVAEMNPTSRKPPQNRHSAKMQTTKNWVTKLNLSVKPFGTHIWEFDFHYLKIPIDVQPLVLVPFVLLKCENFPTVLRRWRWNPGHQKRQIWRQAVLLPATSVEVLKQNTSWQGCQMMSDDDQLFLLDKNPNKTKPFFCCIFFDWVKQVFPTGFSAGKELGIHIFRPTTEWATLSQSGGQSGTRSIEGMKLRAIIGACNSKLKKGWCPD